MNDKDIEKDYKLKISQLLKYNSFYYNKNYSLVTDQEYDELKKNIIDLEKKYKFLKDKNSIFINQRSRYSINFRFSAIFDYFKLEIINVI